LKDNEENLAKVIDEMANNVAHNIPDGSIIGLGSGSTVAIFVLKLGKISENKEHIFGVIPSSLQIQIQAEEVGLNILSPKMIPSIDITIDGADQIDEKYNLIKGGGGALYKERVLLNAAKKSIILADESKYAKKLCKSIPIEVSFFARKFVLEELIRIGGKPILRILDKDYPFTTENGNLIIDTDFGVIEKPEILRSEIVNIAGVIDVGIFIDEGDVFYRANRNGSIQVFNL